MSSFSTRGNEIFNYLALVMTQNAALSSATQHVLRLEFGENWRIEVYDTDTTTTDTDVMLGHSVSSLPLSSLLRAGYSLKLKRNKNNNN